MRRFRSGSNHFANGIVLRKAVTDEDIEVLNENAWEWLKEIEPQPDAGSPSGHPSTPRNPDPHQAEALWREVGRGARWAEHEPIAALAAAFSEDRLLRVTMWRKGLAGGEVAFDRPATLVEAQVEAQPGEYRGGDATSIALAAPITSEQIAILNDNEWRHVRDMEPQPKGRA